MPFARLIGQNIQAGYLPDKERTERVAELKSSILFSPEKINEAKDNADSLRKMEQLGVTLTSDRQGVDVSNSRFMSIDLQGDESKIKFDDKTKIYSPVNSRTERLVTIVQTARNTSGSETYHLLIATAPAISSTEPIIDEKKVNIESNILTEAERSTLNSLISLKELPDTLP